MLTDSKAVIHKKTNVKPLKKEKIKQDWRHNSVLQTFPSTRKALGSITSSALW
jgi:hypothetical protein